MDKNSLIDYSRDPINNAINNGIKRGIRVCIEAEVFGSAVILIYSGIDTMAYLSIPESQDKVTSKDFIAWANRYIDFPCKEQITGEELYGARCGMVHTYSPYSQLSNQGKVRLIGYMDHSIPEVRFDANTSTDLVLVSIKALADAFFRGIDQFLIDMYLDKKRSEWVEKRLTQLVHNFPMTSK